MAQGISLHIGLNKVDPHKYDGWDGALNACEADAKDMAAIAKARGYGSTSLLLSPQATVMSVVKGINSAAQTLKAGDIFFLTYSGHGGQTPDASHDEDDGRDETWVLYDGQLIDDQLYSLFSRFAAGVRIVVLSDSCHSGTVSRAAPWDMDAQEIPKGARLAPLAVTFRNYLQNKATYDALERDYGGVEDWDSAKSTLAATVLLISGCQDNQTSMDGPQNGKFTGELLAVWNNGKYRYGYRNFYCRVISRMPSSQTPNYFLIGAANPAFEKQKPFTI